MPLDFSRMGGSSGGGSYSSPNPFRSFAPSSTGSSFGDDEPLSIPRLAPQPAAPKAESSQNRDFPERLNATNFFGNVVAGSDTPPDETPYEIADFVGQLPARVLESPVATADVLTGSTPARDASTADFGGKQVKFGKEALGGIDKVATAIGQMPVIGDLARAANDILTEASKIGPAIINAGDIDKLRRLQNAPDDAKIRDVDPGFLSGGFAALGNFASWDMTVGEFRLEMLKRGIGPEQMAAVEGGKSNLDFGDRPASTNPLVNIGYSAALDPTNLLLGVGILGKAKTVGSAILKPVRSGFGLASKMEKAGVASRAIPDAALSAAGIAEGKAAAVTTQGVAHFIKNSLAHPERVYKPYVLGSTAYSAALAATEMTTDWLDNNLPDDAPMAGFVKDLNAFADAVINDHPLSKGPAFAYAAAFNFPIRDFARGGAQAAKKAGWAIKGGQGVASALGDALGVGKSARERIDWFKGRYGDWAGIQTLTDHLDMVIVRNKMNPILREKFGAIDSAAVRERLLHNEVKSIVTRWREEGRISNSERVAVFKGWFNEQGGFEKTGVDQVWNAERAAQQWNDVFLPTTSRLGRVLQQRTDAVLQNKTNLTVEDIQTIRASWKLQRNPDGTVNLDAMRDSFQTFPQLIDVDRKGKQRFTQFGVRDAKPPKWDTVRDWLKEMEEGLDTDADLTHELKMAEANQPSPTKIVQGPLTENGVQKIDGHREATPEFARDGLAQANPLDDGVPEPPVSNARVPSMDETAPIRAAADEAAGLDPAMMAEGDAAAIQALSETTGLDWSGRQTSGDPAVDLRDFRKQLAEELDLPPGYQLEAPPRIATILRNSEIETPQIQMQLLKMNALAEWLRYTGPLSPLARGLSWLLTPAATVEMRHNAEQAVFSYTLPLGAKPRQIQAIIAELREDATKASFGFRSVEAHWFRSWDSLTPNNINKVARKHLDAPTYAKIEKQYGSFSRMADRSFNRFIQTMHRKGTEGNRLGSAVEAAWATYQGTLPGHLGRAAKTVYPIFRFLMSPRWWAMNAYEANILGLVKYGSGLADKRAGMGTLIHRYGGKPDARLVAGASEVVRSGGPSPLSGRSMEGHISRNFDALRIESAQEVLDSLPTSGIEYQMLVRRFGPDEGTWSQQLDKMLYEFDVKGVEKSLKDEATRIFAQEDVTVLAPVIQRLYEINDKNYKALANMYEGNVSRTNLERIGNSYFLYWPLSYQLKAGKWLVDVMTERAFGRKTNFAGAYTYNHLLQTHKELLGRDEEYRKLFEDNPDTWFAAQMLFPITPFDMGVSLNRGVRYAGGMLGLWGTYQAAKDPLAAAAKIAEMGVVYDMDVLQQVWRDANNNEPKAEKVAKPKAQPAALYPAPAKTPTVVPFGTGSP